MAVTLFAICAEALDREFERWNLCSTPMSPQGERCAIFFRGRFGATTAGACPRSPAPQTGDFQPRPFK
jgi:hypothetical protein